MHKVTSPIEQASAEQVAEMIDIPLDQWPGNCKGIANAVANLVPDWKSAYGFYRGPVDQNSMFNSGAPVQRHGWVITGDMILDPTRWVFENAEPYIWCDYAENTTDYDRGMRSVRQSPCNEGDALEFIDAYLDGERDFDIKLIHDLGNTFPEDMNGLAGEVYDYIKELGHGAFIPIDFWEEVNP